MARDEDIRPRSALGRTRGFRALRLALAAGALFVASFGGRFALEQALLDAAAVMLAAVLAVDRLWYGARALWLVRRLRNLALPEAVSSRFRRRLHMRWFYAGGALDLVALLLLGLYLLSHPLFGEARLHAGPTRDMTVFRAALLLFAGGTALEFKALTGALDRIDLTPGRAIVAAYLGAAALATLILVLPVSLRPEATVTLVDAFFVSMSAITVTGLTPVSFPEVFGPVGQVVVLLLIQIGGLGIVAVSSGLALLTFRRLSLRHAIIGQESLGLPAMGELRVFLARVVATTLTLELVGAAVLWAALPGELDHRWYHGLFHAVSAFCNAGFSTMGSGLAFPGAPAFKATVGVLIVLGGIGYPVLFELQDRLVRRWRGQASGRMSDFSALALTTAVTMLVGGGAAIAVMEATNSAFSWTVVGESLFYSVSSRTAGFHLSDVGALAFNSQLIIALLAVIGGSPMSTAGGIKTTTFAVLILTAVNFMRGRRYVHYRRSEIPLELVQRAVTIVVFYSALAIGAFLLLALLEPHENWPLMFEVVSALSTTGLSLDLTPRLSDPSKLVLVALMVTGRIGLITMIFAGLGRRREQHFRYPKSRIFVG